MRFGPDVGNSLSGDASHRVVSLGGPNVFDPNSINGLTRLPVRWA